MANVQTVNLAPRRRKNSVVVKPSEVKEIMAALDGLKAGQAIAIGDKWYDTEGKARGKARTYALAVAAANGGKQPRTHVIPSEDGSDNFMPALSYKPSK